MHKILTAIALGAGLSLLMPTLPAAQASEIIQTLNTPEMTASQFNTLFTPVANAPVLVSDYQYLGAPVSGVVRSQVFEGQGVAAGLFAYAYQLGVNPVSTTTGEPVHTDSMSFQFNATPTTADLLKSGSPTSAYVIKDGSIGGLVPPQAAAGDLIGMANVSWQPGATIGTIRAQYVNTFTNTPPLDPGSNSSTFIVLSKEPFTQQFVNLQSSNPTTGAPPAVYSATGGTISPVPIPEPATVLAWAGMLGATLLVRRVRKGRAIS